MHFAGADDEVDAVERTDAGELLDDAAHLEQGLWHAVMLVTRFVVRQAKVCISVDILASQPS